MTAKEFLDRKLGSTECIKSQYLMTKKELEKWLEEYTQQQVKLFAIPHVNGSLHVEFGIWLTGHDKETIEQMFNDWNKRQGPITTGYNHYTTITH